VADAPTTEVVFPGGAPDPGRRVAHGLPRPLPEIGDDFDWLTRDYDGFRLFMMEELAARVPERQRWTPADLETVLVEALAAVLDQLSDRADRVAAEAYLPTARRPESVRRLLQYIGYDAVRAALAAGDIRPDPSRDSSAVLDAAWLANPPMMEAARAAGMRAIHDQNRMVTAEDHGRQLRLHPAVLHAGAVAEWGGAWSVVKIGVLPVVDRPIDEKWSAGDRASLQAAVDAFHIMRDVPPVVWNADTTTRSVLTPYVERLRMVGQPVLIEDAVRVGIMMALSIRVRDNHFQSEVRDAIERALGTGQAGFFAPERIEFGAVLHLSDVVQTLMAVDGVEVASVNRFKRVGPRWPDQVVAGRIVLHGIEFASCDNDHARPERGYYSLVLHGGRTG
jgi:hypothetical protein